MKTGFLFAGQGDQFTGMGKSLYDFLPAARRLMDCLDNLRPGLRSMCFSGTEDIDRTVNTQPCMYAADLMAAYALEEKGIVPDAAAGFSVGEIPAMAYSGVLGYAEGFKLVCFRGERMDEASRKHPGAMAAVLKLDKAQTEELCSRSDELWAANYNCPGQITVAGSITAIDELIKNASAMGGRAVRLSVSGGFHCEYMREAAYDLYEYLSRIEYGQERFPVYSNVTAQPYEGNYASLLSRQVCSPVMWEQTIRNMNADGIDTFITMGAGRTLSKLVKRIIPSARVFNCTDAESLEQITDIYHGG